MGWLRDMMGLSSPPVMSYGRLADACLDHSEWPADAEIKPRSLSTLFSKLDRGQDLDWLRDRPTIQQVLAQVLGRPMGDLRSALGETEVSQQGRLLRLRDARFAREFDLTREELPPGLPLGIAHPPGWGPTWWHAPSGSGRSLVGLWLQARGLAQYVTLRNREDVALIPRRGPLFVEVTQSGALSVDDLASLRAEQRPVCVAAANIPQDIRLIIDSSSTRDEHDSAQHSARWTVVTSPGLGTYLGELVDWLGARLDGTGEFSEDRAEQWMRRVAIPHDTVHTFGDALGLLGLLDETTPRALHGRSLDEVAEAFVRRRVKEACLDTSWGPRLASSAFETLTELAARCLVTSGATLDTARTLEEWTALLAAHHKDDSPDPEWLLVALRGSLGSHVSKRELSRAARNLPPADYQLVRSLEFAGLLKSLSDASATEEHTVLAPRWLVTLLEARARTSALDLSPADWGAALLDPAKADAVERGLERRARSRDFTPLELALDDANPSHAASAAAVEASLRAAGSALIDGLSLPEDLTEELLESTAETCLILDGRPRSRTASTEPLEDAWLAALAFACRQHAFPLTHIDPARTDDQELRSYFAHACCRHAARVTPTRGARLLELAAELTTPGNQLRPPLLALVDAMTGKAASHIEPIDRPPVELLLEYVKLSETAIPYDAFWSLLDGRAPESVVAAPDWRRALWQNLPVDVLLDRNEADEEIAWASLLPHHFAAILDDPRARLPEAAAELTPLDATLDALRARGGAAFSPACLAALVERSPGRLTQVLIEHMKNGSDSAVHEFFGSHLQAAAGDICRALPGDTELLAWSRSGIDAVRRFLHACVRQRVGEFSLCYQRLHALEVALAPLRQL